MKIIPKFYKNLIVFALLLASFCNQMAFATSSGKIVIDYTYNQTAINNANFKAYLVQILNDENEYGNTEKFEKMQDIDINALKVLFYGYTEETPKLLSEYVESYNQTRDIIGDFISSKGISADRQDFSKNLGIYTLEDVEDGLYYLSTATVSQSGYRYSSNPVLALVIDGETVNIDAKITRTETSSGSSGGSSSNDDVVEQDDAEDDEDEQVFEDDDEDTQDFDDEKEDEDYQEQDDDEFDVGTDEDSDTNTDGTPNESITLSALKLWEGDFLHVFKPQEIFVLIYCDGEYFDEVALNESNSWYYQWETSSIDSDWIIIENTGIFGFDTDYYRFENDFVIINTTLDPATLDFDYDSEHGVPATGTIANLIPIFAGIGLIFIISGLFLGRKVKNEE